MHAYTRTSMNVCMYAHAYMHTFITLESNRIQSAHYQQNLTIYITSCYTSATLHDMQCVDPVHTYMLHTYVRRYVHTYVRTDIHAYIPTYTHCYIRTYVHCDIHTYIRTYIINRICMYLCAYRSNFEE